MKYLKLIKIFIKNSFQIELEYRIGLFFAVLNSIAYTSLGALILLIMFQNSELVGGWSFNEAIVLYGVYMIMEAFIYAIITPNLWQIPELIRTGNMDFYLIKPLSSQFIASLRNYQFWTIPQFILGLLVIIYSVSKSGQANLINIPITIVFLLSAMAILYSIGLILTTLSFWFVKIGNLFQLLFAIISATRVPVTAYSKPVRIIFSTLVPVVFVTTVPAQAALGKLSIGMAIASITVSTGLLLISHLFWRYAVASYSSASS